MNPALHQVLSGCAVWRGNDVPPPASPSLPSCFAALDGELPGGGWPVGALTEILSDCAGIGELSLLLPALARLTREGQGVVWIAPPFVPYAPALAAAGIDPRHCLVVAPETGRDSLWVAEQALRSGACGAVLAWPEKNVDYRSLRRLQLAAEEGAASAFLFRPESVATLPSPAPLRLTLALEEKHLCVRLLKRRGGATSAPLHLAVQSQRWRQVWEAETVPMSQQPARRPAAAPALRLSLVH